MIYGYARVSDKTQNLDSQLELLKKYGCNKIVSEKITGISEEKKLNKLISSLSPGDTLVSARMDRLGRSTKQLIDLVEQLQTREINLVLLDLSIDTKTPTGKFFLQIMASFSELERTTLKEKQRLGIETAKAKGKHLGRPRAWTKEALEESIRMYMSGRTVNDIETITKVSRASLYREIKKRGIVR